MNLEKKQRILEQIRQEEIKLGRPIKLRRYLAEVNPNIAEAQATVSKLYREDNPLDAKTIAMVNLAAALVTRVPMCIRNNMQAALNAGVTHEEIGAVMAHAQFIAGTAVFSASLEGLETILQEQQA
ncbi:carboxymuconolactone decarboxylase family protein [Sulfobacillus thermosulfidooxidans]|uniref:Alkylhydroperoxidase AhpD family core domain-containing protein n=1 Tax=Sulfobacillus thermosulfidooxidans (strain DSM 9293 / VKM B-1269 / AT-1) TaxID=929705 RepID=A0A1W1WHN9_SULTA|nr:carboxymuconolactone decarboxylase family protein [Sulfobacillus thermosulfidooxidans]OLZ09946.1 carboxymuconolactone decarboxylase [Sulfobacillus thermosulfidooxidans]OLZ15749.1 carboxymuconolactone decarboxylase [Sulfobacillus thermosulfidooxidans]OLZ18404.1 carboxymuconolactone decarboxylase [Sulfobacillus thermosulfidooxidans]SMC05550.1 alkylhydroperoxidase AhpD family core domain-containing protein [Sulfobacillus thermosulfidooxidans DSM 9293]